MIRLCWWTCVHYWFPITPCGLLDFNVRENTLFSILVLFAWKVWKNCRLSLSTKFRAIISLNVPLGRHISTMATQSSQSHSQFQFDSAGKCNLEALSMPNVLLVWQVFLCELPESQSSAPESNSDKDLSVPRLEMVRVESRWRPTRRVRKTWRNFSSLKVSTYWNHASCRWKNKLYNNVWLGDGRVCGCLFSKLFKLR